MRALAKVFATALALSTFGCSHDTLFVPDVLAGSVVRGSHTEIEIAPDFADSASATVHGVDAAALGLAPGDRVRVRRLGRSVGKADPLDWDCRAAWACEVRRE